jgi:hypothetical protein
MSTTDRLVKEASAHAKRIETLIAAAHTDPGAASELKAVVIAVDEALEGHERKSFMRHWARVRETALYNTNALRHYMRVRMKREMKPVMSEKVAAEFRRRFPNLQAVWKGLGVTWNAATLKDLLNYKGPPREWLFRQIGAHLEVSHWTVRLWDLRLRHSRR